MTELYKQRSFRFSFFAALFLASMPGFLFAQQKLYWTDASETSPKIHCVYATSAAGCSDTTTPSNTVLLDFSGEIPEPVPSGIVVDDKNNKIIWTNNLSSTGSIERSDLDGKNRETIASNQDNPKHLAIDLVNNKIYWSTNYSIYRCSLGCSADSETPEEITSFSGYTINIKGLTLDPSASLLFWSAPFSTTTKIYRSIIDSNVNNMSLDFINILTLPMPDSMDGLTVSESDSKLYWAENTAGKLQFAGYGDTSDSSLLADATSANASGLQGVVIDYPETNIFFGNSTEKTVYRSSLTSPAAEAFVATSGEIGSLAISCGRYAESTLDTDKTPDCMDGCPEDGDKTEPGACGCGEVDSDTDGDSIPDCDDPCDDSIDTDGDGGPDCLETCDENELKYEPDECPCDLLADINIDGELVCVKTRELAPNTEIEAPPAIEIQGDDVTIVLEKFKKVTLTLKKKKKKKNSVSSYSDNMVEIQATGLKVRYEIQLTKVGGAKRDIKKLTSKRNELTVRNLPLGNYEVKYKAIITQNGSDVAKTKFSPAANFTVE